MSHACHPFWKCCGTLAFCSLLRRCTIPCACHAKRDLKIQKCSVPVSFLHFWLRNGFAPQRRALLRHLNFQIWSEHGVFCTFWLRNVLRATMACIFSTSQLPKVVRSWGALCILTWKCASRATTACNFSSLTLIWAAGSAPAALASLLFDPLEPQIIGKTQCFATFLPFRASASSFFWLFLFSDLLSSTLLFSLTLPISAFHLSILLEVWLLNFLRWCYLMLAVIVDLANWCCHSLSLLVWAITSRMCVNRLICYFAMCRQAKGTPRFLDEVEVQCSLKEFEEHATFVPVLTWFFNSTHGMGQGKWAVGVRCDGQGPFLWVIVSFSQNALYSM